MKPSKKAEIISKIQSLYDAGVPFFTKEALRDLHHQLQKRPKRGELIFVKGVDGSETTFTVETGFVCDDEEKPELQHVFGEPEIAYQSFQSLVNEERLITNNAHAYCSMRIFYSTSLRNTNTNEVVDDTLAQSPEEIEKVFESTCEAWEASQACKQLVSTLLSVNTTCLDAVRKVIGLGLGHMDLSCYDAEDAHTQRPWYQHALILTLRRILTERKTNTEALSCYAQDPAYSESAKTVLHNSGVAVLSNPEGFLEVDESSIVVSCAPNVPVCQIVLDIARPAMMIWDKVTEKNESQIPEAYMTNPASSRVRKIIRECYDEVDFPQLECLGSMTMYVRRAASS